jgi:DNA modification methylase
MPDKRWEIRQGDALELLRSMPEASVQCCVTSPPYWGLRDYGTARWEGGEDSCDHVYNHGVQGAGGDRATRTFTAQAVYKNKCGKCGARRIDRQLGLEATPDGYVVRMVEVFREVRRVLRDDGTLWLNIGDSYNAYNGGAGPGSKLSKTQTEQRPKLATGFGLQCKSLKPKDLIGIPWLLAFALRADGWYLRADIVWAKLAPMPESVRDRPTRSHEFVFLLAKSQRYYYDADAIREPASYLGPNGAQLSPYAQGFTRRTPEEECERRRRAKGNAKTFRGGGVYTQGQSFDNSADVARDSHGNAPNESMTRNKRDVWLLGPQPFPEAHFATFPEKLVEPCVLAGCPEGGMVLDPFAGSGTAGVVALRHRRDFIGLELSPTYCEMARRRLALASAQGSLLSGAQAYSRTQTGHMRVPLLFEHD